MITDTCSAHIKQSVHAELLVQMEMANTADLLFRSLGSDDVPPYALHSEAPSQFHLCGPTVFIPVEFSIWGFSGEYHSVLAVVYNKLHTLLL